MKSLINYIRESIDNSFTLTAVGDALCHNFIYDYFETDNGYDFTDIFSKYDLNKNNLNYVNVESIIGGKKLGLMGSKPKMEQFTKQEHFNSPEEFGDVLVNKGFNLISLANNHVLDVDEKGVLNSLKYWSSQPVICAGSYRNEDDRFSTHIYNKNGIKYAFFAYTMKYNTKDNFKDHPYYRNDWNEELIKNDIISVRDKVDLIIVSVHWGSEHTFTPNKDQLKAANFLASLGVDIVLGSHSHCVQPVQYIGKTLVVYSLGNFISKQLYDRTSTRIGLEININISKNQNGIILSPSFRLLYMYYTQDCKDFKVIPWEKLTESELPNKKYIGESYSAVVNKYNVFNK